MNEWRKITTAKTTGNRIKKSKNKNTVEEFISRVVCCCNTSSFTAWTPEQRDKPLPPPSTSTTTFISILSLLHRYNCHRTERDDVHGEEMVAISGWLSLQSSVHLNKDDKPWYHPLWYMTDNVHLYTGIKLHLAPEEMVSNHDQPLSTSDREGEWDTVSASEVQLPPVSGMKFTGKRNSE